MNRKELELLERIAINPKVMVGQPVVRGSRITVKFVLGLLGHNMSIEQILAEYPGLTREDILACLMFAQKSLEDITFMPLTVEGA